MGMKKSADIFKRFLAIFILALIFGCLNGSDDSESSSKDTDDEAEGEEAITYSMADLSGDWGVNILATGPAAPWWQRGIMSIGSDGAFTMDTREYGSEEEENSTSVIQITSEGIFTVTGSNWRGSMDADKTVMAATSTWSFETGYFGTSDMLIMTKKGESYSEADLWGTWYENSLTSGPDAPWWETGTFYVLMNGSFNYETINSSDPTERTGTGEFIIAEDGTVTMSIKGIQDPTFLGRMDAGKTFMVATCTRPSGATELKVFTKKGSSAVSYSRSDLVGTWAVYSLATGVRAPHWFRATVTIDETGSFTGPTTIYDGLRTFSDTISGALNISYNGRLSSNGSMDAGKTIMTQVYSWPTEAPDTGQITIWLRLTKSG